MLYVKVAVYSNIDKLLTYKAGTDLNIQPGCRVIVPLGRKYATGLVTEVATSLSGISEIKIKPIHKLIDETPVIDEKMIKLGLWAADYYLAAPGKMFSAMLSALNKSISRRIITLSQPDIETDKLSEGEKRIIEYLKVKRKKRALFLDIEKAIEINIDFSVKTLKEKGIVTDIDEAKLYKVKAKTFKIWLDSGQKPGEIRLNPYQKQALEKIEAGIDKGSYRTFLLLGITGSGKTEVYIRAAKHCLESGRQAIVLVPEIFLTPQILERFRQEFKDKIALFHSALRPSERLNEWQKMKTGEANIVIGTRSAIFAPFTNPGLIIVDEEFDGSYKQESTPRYNARDLAVYRGSLSNAAVILGSATPSVETYSNAKTGKYEFINLPERIASRPMPEVKIIDLKFEPGFDNSMFLSEEMLKELRATLDNKEQAILFINRRGFSSYVFCPKCGYIEKCPNCDIPLIYHRHEDALVCHYCDTAKKPDQLCPSCGKKLLYKGIGTQKVEDVIAKLFPDKRIERVDIDSMEDAARYFKVYNAIKNREIDILIGTQMIAKGFDFPEVTFVGVVSIDTVLNLPDFRSEERVFQLLMQVAGRTGRGDKPGKVIIQTYNPLNTAVQSVKNYETEKFYEEQLEIRKKLFYPPFARLIQIIVQDKSEEKCSETAEAVRKQMDSFISKAGIKSINILGPAPAPLTRIRGKYRYSIILKGRSLADLNRVARQIKDTGKDMSIIVDPINML